MTGVAEATSPRVRWLTARIAELGVDIAYLGPTIERIGGRAAFDFACALEDAIRERTALHQELQTYEVTPC